MIFLATLLTAVLVTIALIPMFSSTALRLNAVDMPSERKVHTTPIPRIGGLAMALGSFAPLLYMFRNNDFLVAYMAGAGLLVIFGLVDDFRDISPRVKFFGQFLAAAIAVLHGGVVIVSFGTLLPDGWMLPVWISIPFTMFVIVGVTNAINLSDGLDGLAGGICLLIFAVIGYLAYLSDNSTIGLISLAIGGALFGFLRFNTHPASIFMGDSGSQFLGFSVVTLSIALTQGSRAYSPLLPLILVGFPVLDTLTVMITRIYQKRSPFSADKNHFHHHLLKLGFRHPESVLVIYCIQTLLILVAVIFRYYSDWLLLTGYLAFSTVVISLFAAVERTGQRLPLVESFNRAIIPAFRRIKAQGSFIRHTFPIFANGVPLLLFITCLLPSGVPLFVKGAAALFGLLNLVVLTCASSIAMQTLRIAIYLLIPCAVYFGDLHSEAWLKGFLLALYNLSFGILAILMVIVSKLSRRTEGFKSTPLDFLIIILAVILPVLADQRIHEYRIGLMAAKIIMLYFSFEVLFAELRGKTVKVSIITVCSLTALALS